MRSTLVTFGVLLLFPVGILLGRFSALPPVQQPASSANSDALTPAAPLSGAATKDATTAALTTTSAASATSPAHGDSLTPTSPFAIQPATYHYGKVMEGEARQHEFQIAAPQGQPLKLGRLYSPCPCIAVTAKTKVIPANTAAVFDVAIHSLTLEGTPSFPVYVEIVEPTKTVLRADVTIESARVPAKMLIQPESFHFGSVRGAKTAEVRLYNLTKRPLEVKTLTSGNPAVKVSCLEGTRVASGKFATLQAKTPENGLPAGPISGIVSVETDCSEHARIDIPLDGTALGK